MSANLQSVTQREYFYYDHPSRGDMHEVVPKKFLALRGPVGAHIRSSTDHSPEELLEVFRSKNVHAVIRLNESVYDASIFHDSGIAHHDLQFEDCSTPPDRIVDKFLRICEETDGLIAIHCLVGTSFADELVEKCWSPAGISDFLKPRH